MYGIHQMSNGSLAFSMVHENPEAEADLVKWYDLGEVTLNKNLRSADRERRSPQFPRFQWMKKRFSSLRCQDTWAQRLPSLDV